jgi:hypothetical protein
VKLSKFPGNVLYLFEGRPLMADHDSPFSLDAWAKKENIQIPLLSDYEHTVAATRVSRRFSG